MRIVVLTGMSGSGKTNALRALEDVGFYAIDNLPVPLIDRLVELFSASQSEIEKLVLVVDARTAAGSAASRSSDLPTPTPGNNPQTPLPSAGELELVPAALELTRRSGHDVDLVFLDAADDVLVRRFSETRRRHPLGAGGSVRGGIEAERELLAPLRARASLVVDTSAMSVHELRRHVQQAFQQRGTQRGSDLQVTIMSFGFKHGLPAEADLVFDVRFIPNPYFVEELRPKTGEDSAVAAYVLRRDETQGFLDHVRPFLEFLLPHYEREGKAYLTVAFGCTGGRHRSVALAADTGRWLREQGHPARVLHRDLGR